MDPYAADQLAAKDAEGTSEALSRHGATSLSEFAMWPSTGTNTLGRAAMFLLKEPSISR